MEEQDLTPAPHKKHFAKSFFKIVTNAATNQERVTENNKQYQLFDKIGEAPDTGVPTPTEANIPISEDDSKNIENVITDVKVKSREEDPGKEKGRSPKSTSHNAKDAANDPVQHALKKTQPLKTFEEALEYQKQDIFESLRIDKLAEQSKVDPFVKMEKPPSVLEINGTPIGTRGNFSVLNGKPKSRKTIFALLLTMAKLDNNSLIYKPIKNKTPFTNAIYFDTEQSKYDVSFIGNRVVTKLELKPESTAFSLYGLRRHSPGIRLKIIEEVLYKSENISFVVIDGIADLVSNGYNNESDAFNIVSKLLKWTEELNIHIVVIIHQNKGDSNAKGHLGGMLIQKAETVLNVTRSTHDDSISIASAAVNRRKEIEDIHFTFDENIIPVLTDAPTSAVSKDQLKRPTDFDYEFKLNLIEKVFSLEQGFLYGLLINKLKHYLSELGYTVGDSILRLWITYYIENKLILQHLNKKPYTLNIDLINEERIKYHIP